jgi:hypothetical protein
VRSSVTLSACRIYSLRNCWEAGSALPVEACIGRVDFGGCNSDLSSQCSLILKSGQLIQCFMRVFII